MKKIQIAIFILFAVFMNISFVSAAEKNNASLSIHPSIMDLSLSPGKTSSTSLSITNNGNSPIFVRLRFEPLVLSDSPKQLQSIGSWIHLSDSSLLIPSQKETRVEITITIPKTVPLGGYYGMLYVEPLASTQSSSGSLVLTKMGVLIFGSVGVQDVPLNSIELQKPLLNAFVSETSTLPLSFGVKNTALNHITAKPYLIIHPLFGKNETVQLDERLVFPGTKRDWKTFFTVQNSDTFYYTADLYVSIGNGLSKKQSFSFIIFPVQQSIILVLCIAVTISIIRKRKQIKKAVKIMIKG